MNRVSSIRRSFQPLGDKEKILEKLDAVATEIEDDMQRSGWTAKTVTLKFKLDTYQGSYLLSPDTDVTDVLIFRFSVHPREVIQSLDHKERGSIRSELIFRGRLLTAESSSFLV
jgi:hypothetical protein